MQLNGTSQYFTRADGGAGDPTRGGDIELECGAWVYLDRVPTSTQWFGIISKAVGATPGTYSYSLDATNGYFRFVISSATTSKTIASAAVVAGQWYFVRGWHNPVTDTIHLVVNGVASTPVATEGAFPQDAAHTFEIGRAFTDASLLFPGRIDQAYVKRGISATVEATALRNNGKGVQWAEVGQGDLATWGEDVAGFWEFDNASNLGLDSTANGLNLTPTASPLRGTGVNYLEGTVS